MDETSRGGSKKRSAHAHAHAHDTKVNNSALKAEEQKALEIAATCSEPKNPYPNPTPYTLRGSTYCEPDNKYTLDRKFHHLSRGASLDAALLGRTSGNDYGLGPEKRVQQVGTGTGDCVHTNECLPFSKTLFAEFLAMLPEYVANQCGSGLLSDRC